MSFPKTKYRLHVLCDVNRKPATWCVEVLEQYETPGRGMSTAIYRSPQEAVAAADRHEFPNMFDWSDDDAGW